MEKTPLLIRPVGGKTTGLTTAANAFSLLCKGLVNNNSGR